MKKKVLLEFSELKKNITIELDDSEAPKTVKAIIDSLPISMVMQRWGDELYSEPTLIDTKEENAQTEVRLFDAAFWPEGKALCFFYGHTPLSSERILPYSPVNVVGKIKTDISNISTFLSEVQESHIMKRVPVILRV